MKATTRSLWAVAVAALLAATCFVATPVHAEPVTFLFSGEVIDVEDPLGAIGDAVDVGDPVSGSYTFESTTPDTEGSLPTLGKYDGAMSAWDIDLGSAHFSLGNFSSIVVTNAAEDAYQILARLSAPFGGDMVWNAFWNFLDPTGTLFSSTALPLTAPDVLPLQTPTSVFFSDETQGHLAVRLDVFVTEGAVMTGDMDLNQVVDFDDISPFVLALSDDEAYEEVYGVPPIPQGDTDGNGILDFDDIAGLIEILGGAAIAQPALGTSLHAVPEPASRGLAAAALALLGVAQASQRRGEPGRSS